MHNTLNIPSNPELFINISEFNAKLGPVPSFSVLCGVSCPKNVPCLEACYAKAMETIYSSYFDVNLNNLHMLLKYADRVEDVIVGYILLSNTPLFRFNVDGDLEVDLKRPELYVNLILNVARRCPDCEIWFYSKSELLDLIPDAYPNNLYPIESQWRGWKPNIKHRFPITDILKEDEDRTGKLICPNSLAEEKLKKGEKNPIKCFNCRLCLKLKVGQILYFIAHGRGKNKIGDLIRNYYNKRDSKGRFTK